MEHPASHSSDQPLLQTLARLVSTITSPFIVTAATVTVVIVLLHPPVRPLLLWAAISLVFAAGVPFLFVYRLWREGRISDVHVAVRSQRGRPFAAALLSAAVGVALLQVVHAPPPLVALGVVYLANGLTLALISRRWKISVHTSVLAAGIIAVGLLGCPEALSGLALVPLVLWARVHRGKHTLFQGLVPVVLAAVITPPVYWAAIAILPPG